MWKKIKVYFLTGLLVLIPLVVTIVIFWRLFVFVDSILGDTFGEWIAISLFGYKIPGIGFILILLVVFIVGIVARNILGRTLIQWGEKIVARIPLIRSIYRGIQQISNALLSDQKGFFKTPVLIEYPRKEVYSIAFLTSEHQSVKIQEGVKLISVFIPTTPNPTSGFFLMLPEKDVRRLDMSVEDAMKLIISGGAVKISEHL